MVAAETYHCFICFIAKCKVNFEKKSKVNKNRSLNKIRSAQFRCTFREDINPVKDLYFVSGLVTGQKLL